MTKLSELLKELDYKLVQGSLNKDISAVVYDSRKVIKDCLFICISGANFDGHEFASKVVDDGATVLITEKDIDLKDESTTVIKVENTRYAMAFISAAWFNHPADKLTVIGITGTKGKTTTTYLVKSILEHSGRKCGLIGTIEVIIGETHIHANNTTPESYLIQEYFAQMVEAGLDSVVMEVSSQGLMLHRTQGFIFDIGIFTNLEPDHIGPNEHKDLDDYIHCKSLLFKQCKTGIFNTDADYYDKIFENHTCKAIGYSINTDADLKATNIELINKPGILGVEFDASGIVNAHFTLPNPGLFSVYNALCAIAICNELNINTSTMQDGLHSAKVKGRIEPVKISDDFTLLIDYAHNAMALESLLTTLKAYNPGRLVSVFGCGGNRSKLRRYDMGEVSGKLADLTIITSDNPRFEEPQDIINDIKIGISRTNGSYIEICDRKEAIRYAINNAQPGDIIVLAGKGHEDYQEIKGVKYPMDERDLIADIMFGQ